MLGDLTGAVTDARYRASFGRVAGYLPKDRRAVDAWLADLADRAQARTGPHSPAVAAMEKLIETDRNTRSLVAGTLEQLPRALQPIQGVGHLLQCVDQIITTAPEYRAKSEERILFPLSALFANLALTKAGESLLRTPAFNSALQQVLREWCVFLDSPASRSVLTEADNGWLSPHSVERHRLDDYEIPDRGAEHWGFASFNDFFHRKLKPGARPVSTDPTAVLAPSDGTLVRHERKVGKNAGFTLKGQTFSLAETLNNSSYTDRFVGGDVLQLVLPATGYHRWHAPVDGVVRHVEVVPGLVFGTAELDGSGPVPQGVSFGGAAASSTRALVFIESTAPRIGMVCLAAVGIGEISSVTPVVREDQEVRKGDELGYFSYGGSTHFMAFEPGSDVEPTVEPSEDVDPEDDPQVATNAPLANAG
ncbi:phosphatidylserine decarboxylase family protein [Kitasatospora xanthocidica]|nr:phosphatidylserine decarboxylase family protein [Kitasatospora xanthocidica]